MKKTARKKEEKIEAAAPGVSFPGGELPNRMLFRPDEVAGFFGVSKKTIYFWIQMGKLTACKPNNGAVRILRESIRTAIESSLTE